MADIKSKEERSANMAKIQSKNTRPEMYIRSALFKRNHRFRVNYKAVEGHPDIYFTRTKVAIFVHGCYWHRHEKCKYAYTPKSNTDFWLAKFEANKRRDDVVYDVLQKNGTHVLIVWECTIRRMKRDTSIECEIISQIENFIGDITQTFLEI